VTMGHAFRRSKESGPEAMRDDPEFKALLSDVSQASTIEKQCRSDLIEVLLDGKFLGLGFEPPRRVKSIPTIIPTTSWRGRVKWPDGTLQHEGLAFGEVRILPADRFQELRKQRMLEGLRSPDPTRRGPKGTKRQLHAVYIMLRDEGLIDHGASLRSHSDLIRTRFHREYQDTGLSSDRPSYETIRSAIGGEFRADKRPA